MWAVIMTAYITGTSTRKVDDLVKARAENSHQPTRVRERVMKRFVSPGQAQWFLLRSAVSEATFGPVVI